MSFHASAPMRKISETFYIGKNVKTKKLYDFSKKYDDTLTEDFAESHVKKRVKKGGSLPSMTI